MGPFKIIAKLLRISESSSGVNTDLLTGTPVADIEVTLPSVSGKLITEGEIDQKLNDITGGAVSYSNPVAVPLAVGGISAGTTFNDKTITQMFDSLLYPDLAPSLSPPDNSFSSSQAGLHEVGETLNVYFSASFSRGSINPAYGTSGFRSGLPVF